MFKIGDILTASNYTEAAFWCNKNNATIEVMEKGRYRIVAIPAPTEDELIEQNRALRDAAINAIIWRVQRFDQQTALGIATNDNKATYMDLLCYVQYLRDMPKQEGFATAKIPSFDEFQAIEPQSLEG